MATPGALVTRVLIGRPLRSDHSEETLLPKRLALPVFCSDPLSSVAYATEQMILVLGLGGLSLLYLTPWLGAAVVALLVIVVASYRQTCAPIRTAAAPTRSAARTSGWMRRWWLPGRC